MKAYLSILKIRFIALLQYRLGALAGLGTQLFWGIIKVMILQAFYASSSVVPPISLNQAIAFIWLSQALLQLIPWKSDMEIEEQIHNGNVAYELVRPINLYWMWFTRCIALKVAPTFLRYIPLFVLALLFLGLCPPITKTAGVGFACSLACSVLLSASITTLVIVSLFWTISGEGVKRFLPHFAALLSGLFVPLPLFPSWIQPFLSFQPFRGVFDIPIRIYTGLILEDKILFYLLFQLTWTIILIWIGKNLLSKAIKKFVIMGG